MTQIDTESQEGGQGERRIAVPVRIESSAVVTRDEAAPRASFYTYNLTGTDQGPTRILPRMPNRKEAYIELVNVSGLPILFVNYDVSAVFQGIGFRFRNTNGDNITIKNQRELYAWCTGGVGTSISLSVIDQFYDPEQGIYD
jgi:hypothetical protein